MKLEEAFKTIIDKINENFKAGVYDVNDASVILNSITVIGKALGAAKVEDSVETDCEKLVEEPTGPVESELVNDIE